MSEVQSELQCQLQILWDEGRDRGSREQEVECGWPHSSAQINKVLRHDTDWVETGEAERKGGGGR